MKSGARVWGTFRKNPGCIFGILSIYVWITYFVFIEAFSELSLMYRAVGGQTPNANLLGCKSIIEEFDLMQLFVHLSFCFSFTCLWSFRNTFVKDTVLLTVSAAYLLLILHYTVFFSSFLCLQFNLSFVNDITSKEAGPKAAVFVTSVMQWL